VWGATGAVAAAAGPSLGGLLVDWQGWRWIFFVNLLIGVPALLAGRRLLREQREAATSYPDVLGALLLTAGVAALALAIVEGPAWGWASPGVAAALAVAAVTLPLFVVRSARHPAPMIELSLFRVRSFAVAGAGVFVFALGFYALLLANVLFLTSVWRYSVLHAGVALTPGPLMAALAAPVGGRLSDRFGQRVVTVPGGLLFAAGAALLTLQLGATPRYVSGFLPAVLLTGAGVGLSFAGFGSAAVAELPRSRYATGSAISSTFRQLGAVLGISGLIAALGTPGSADAIAAFHRVWGLVALTGVVAAGTAVALGRVRARQVEEPQDVTVATAAPLPTTPAAAAQGGKP
jgi:MFS family permease